jgi:hypothetical protein
MTLCQLDESLTNLMTLCQLDESLTFHGEVGRMRNNASINKFRCVYQPVVGTDVVFQNGSSFLFLS